ncbi:hypothetical protein TRICI_005774 [Trichomonascus ciferrii]|uniref:Fumarylacetoacetase-like C-terminal domain-containing protein n=1 Tax=Trichomonascus ciferrii TaxID=44093 RepID=A0A642UPM8_9ASCO|nr:hypothetical protein TRICI_005774 [Trichomonascus ciferrii]
MVTWTRLIRFIATDGKTYKGEPIVSTDEDIGKLHESDRTLQALEIKGDDIFSDECIVSDNVLEVKKLLGPLVPDDVPLVKCVGLNYMNHLQGKMPPPPYPSIFIKPRTAVSNHNEPVPIPKLAQVDQADYEGEFCVVIGKEGKDIPESKALSCVAGYTVGNDVSARTWQSDPNVIPDPSGLRLQTWVNGEKRQDSDTNDLIFSVAKIISFISQGTTLEKGTVIMTGTPDGVGASLKEKVFLKDGDRVEISVDKIGTLSNTIKFL